MKQKNAFPPNFVHSLDSSHMMLTSIMCERQGITFVSVHDCFWTHPASVKVMGKVSQFCSICCCCCFFFLHVSFSPDIDLNYSDL